MECQKIVTSCPRYFLNPRRHSRFWSCRSHYGSCPSVSVPFLLKDLQYAYR